MTDSSILEAGRKAGVGLHISSLPGPHGIGDINDAAMSFVDLLVGSGIRVWQFLPTGPTAFGDSPYQPLSAFAGNPTLIGMDQLVRLGLLRPSDLAVLNTLSRTRVEYGSVIRLKSTLLDAAAECFGNRQFPQLKIAYEEFLHEQNETWLDDFAKFRMLKTIHGEKAWPQWEKPFRRRQSPAINKVVASHQQVLSCIKFQQFLFSRQWQCLKRHAEMSGISLFGDMPIYIALDSSDAWAQPELLQINADGKPSDVAGVPPDYFSEDGQLWGNPLYDWVFQEQTGYEWWINRIRHATRQADLVRVDHFRGFESFWSVRFGAETARRGSWKKGPGDALFDTLHATLGRLPIVAEDLGVITPEVVALRERHGIPGMRVLQFDIADPEFTMDSIEENCVCYTGTHDNDTTIGWFRGSKDDTQSEEEWVKIRSRALQLTAGSPQTIHMDMIKLAFSSKAALAIAPLQDYLGMDSHARMNIPGTSRDNWRWRFRPEDLHTGMLDQISALISDTGRAGQAP